MSKYNNSKIYKIVCNETNLCYFGSTIEKYLSNRLGKHVSSYKYYLKGKRSNITSFKVLEKNNYEIILIENVCCNDIYELRNRERFYIENNECVNKCIPNRTPLESKKIYSESEKSKEYQKKYRESEKGKEYHKEYHKKYRESEKYKEYRKKYYESKKGKESRKKYNESEKRKESRKKYYESKKLRTLSE